MDRSRQQILVIVGMFLVAGTFVLPDYPMTPPIAVAMRAGETPLSASDSHALLDQPARSSAPEETGYGNFTAQIVLDGKSPILPPLVSKGDQRKDPECCRNQIPDERLLVDSKTSGIRNVFVYLAKAPVIHPDLHKSSQREVEVRGENCRYIPHALIARTDQVIMFKVVDKCGHSAHAYPLRNTSHCRAISLGSPAVPLSYKVAEREPFPVACDIHPWMKGRWLILDHPYSAITDETGKFRIEKLPAGDHHFVIWHEAAGFVDKALSVTIKADETADQGALKVPVDKFKL